MRIRPNSCKICKICKTQFYPTIVSRCVLDNCPLHPKQSYGDFCVSCVNNVQCCAPPRTTRQFEKIMGFQPFGMFSKQNGVRSPPRNPKYPWLDWRQRPLITNNSTNEIHFTWNLKRKTPCIPDIYFEEMYDLNGKRIY